MSNPQLEVRRSVPSGVIRVASVPSSHVYVRHLSDPDGSPGVVRLPDVPPPDGRRVPGGWWPPLMLDSDWISANRHLFDVFHVHFGFDEKQPEELDEIGLTLRALGVPLIVTLHDLRNPHHRDTRLHDAQLSALVRRADALITLTPGASRAIERRFGRVAEVIPHPHVVELDRIDAPRPSHEGFVAGVHAKSLRANMDVLPVVEALAAAARELPRARVRVNVHTEIQDPASYWYAPQAARELRELALGSPVVELVEHEYFGDEELWDYLAGLDVSVLPYMFGTHSGWLEACSDLGTTVIAPECGFYTEQRPCIAYRHDERGLDAASLRHALERAYDERPAPRPTAAQRRAERRRIAAAHLSLYSRLLA